MDRMYVIITSCIFLEMRERKRSLDHYEDKTGRHQNVGAASGSQRDARLLRCPDPLISFQQSPSDARFQVHSKQEQFRPGFGILNVCSAYQCSFALPCGGNFHQCNSLTRAELKSGSPSHGPSGYLSHLFK